MPAKDLAAKQDRSRETMHRLLKAATEVLSEKGLEGATIPRIAAKAGLSPGAVYRRFPDKDALMQRVVIAVMESSDKGLQQILEMEEIQKMDLKSFLERIVAKTILSYRKYAKLLKAARQFAQSHPNAKFRKKAEELELRSFRRLTEFLLTKSKEIRHPSPETALPFAMMLNSFTLVELIILHNPSDQWSTFLPKDDAELQKELTRAILRYLGIEK